MYELLEERSKICNECGNMFPAFVARRHPIAKMLTLQQKGIVSCSSQRPPL